MIRFPNAKINIGLHVTEKRSDGFHNIESVFYPIDLSDALEIIENRDTQINKDVEFTSSGLSIPGDPAANLCLMAYYLIKKDYYLPPVKMHLLKTIPIGAGLGGGSADAAFCIRLLNDLFELNLSWGEMHHYARQLGSDCSFFISNQPAFVEGRGDQYESMELNLKPYHLILIYPGIHINTAAAYQYIIPKKPLLSLEEHILKLPIEGWRESIHNDFEDSVFQKYPSIQAIKEKLYSCGALYASMSGSGSAVYGIFENDIDLTKEFLGYLVWKGNFFHKND